MASSGSRTVASHLSQPGTGNEPAPPTPSGVAFLVWALGCGAALTSLGIGSLRFQKLARDALPVRDPAWRQQTDAIRRRLLVRSQVRILMSPKVPTPMAGGPWRPVILLPSGAQAWSPERRAVVLAHELIHVRRRDALRQVVGRAVVALYWFHPLSWAAWRAATIAAERSCDEEVLELGARPSEYARHLFSLASGTTGGRPALALPMVQRSQLENRIMSILKRHRPRYSPARTIAALVGLGVAGTFIACANPVPRDPGAQPAPREETTVSNEGQAQDRVIPAPSPELASAARSLPEQASAPDRLPVTPEAALDAIRQAFECNPGNLIGVMRQRGEWTLQRRVDDMRLCMRSHGNVEMAPDYTSIQDMDDDSRLVLESEAERLHRMVIAPGPGGLEYDWSIDGRPEVSGDEAEEWRDLMLTVLGGYLAVQEVRGEEASLRGQIATHRGHVAALRGEAAAHRGHVAALRGEVAAHRGHIASLRGLRAATEALETLEMRETMADLAELSETLSPAADDWTTLADDLRRIERDLAARRDEIERVLAGRIAAIEGRIAEYDLDGKVAAIESQMARYDLDGKIAEIEAQIDQYDLNGKIRGIEAQIEELDADRRADEIERSLQDEITALRTLIG